MASGLLSLWPLEPICTVIEPRKGIAYSVQVGIAVAYPPSMSALDLSKYLTEKEISVVRGLVARLTERVAAEQLHISRNSLQRLLARLPSQRGTVALVRVRLTALGAMRWNESGERTTPV